MNYWICNCGRVIPWTTKEDCECGISMLTLSAAASLGLTKVVSFRTEEELERWIKMMNQMGGKLRR